MNWLEKIRSLPQGAKLRLMWTIAALVAILLVAVWIMSYRYYKHAPADSTLFQTLGRGFHDLKTNYGK
jgi:hypothetical protein